MRLVGSIAPCLLLLGLAVGCGDDAAMSREEVEAYVQDALTQNDTVGRVESVRCEGGLSARKDEQVTCRVGNTEMRIDVTVLVTAVGDSELDLTLEYMTLNGLK